MADADFEKLTFVARIKSRMHRRRTAFAIREEDCSGCGVCVTSCPEDAIVLKKEVAP